MVELHENCALFGVIKRHPDAEGNISKKCYTGLFQLKHRGHEGAGISVYKDGAVKTLKGADTMDWVFRDQVPIEELADFIISHQTKRDLIRYICRHSNLSDETCKKLYSSKKKEDLMKFAISLFEETNRKNPLDLMNGTAAIGHLRYSTTGVGVQPIEFERDGKIGSLAHNGNVLTDNLREEIERRGRYNNITTSDTGLIAELLQTSKQPTFLKALIETLKILEGAFSLLILYDGKIYAVKDRFSIRPLCLGETDSHYFVASESAALDNFRANFLGELKPGALIVLGPAEKDFRIEYQWHTNLESRRCVFEDIYFSAPHSIGSNNTRVALLREAMGREMAREHPLREVDIVAPVLDSGLFAAVGYARELEKIYANKHIDMVDEGGIIYNPDLFGYAFVRGRVDRIFLEPVADERKLLQNLKHLPIPEFIQGKHVAIIDDSIVRGSAAPYIVETLRFFGAKRISVIIPAPPVRSICHLGVDIPTYEELIAHNRTVEEIREKIGADYLGYLSIEGLYRALGVARGKHCDGCFTGEYPVPLPDRFKYRPKEK